MPDHPPLGAALRDRINRKIKDRETASSESREATAAALAADAKLYGTPAWDLLPDARKARVAAHVLHAERGTSDAA